MHDDEEPRDAPLPLAGVRVAAVEHSVAGPLCSRILGELGADVIKVERPEIGDFSRHWDENVVGEGAQFWWLNGPKRSVVLDLKTGEGQRILHELLADADVMVHNLATASATRLGLDSGRISAAFPRLINCQISGYGAEGPGCDRKAYDMLIQAEAGVMSLTGTDEQPMRVGVSISDVTTGIYAALLILAALRERDQTNRGRHLDVAMMDVTLEFLGPMLMSYLNAGVTYSRAPEYHHAIAPYGMFTCRDGERVLIAIQQDDEWRRFCHQVLGDAELAGDSRYATNTGRLNHRADLYAIVTARVAELTSAECVSALADANLAYGKLNDVSRVVDGEMVDHRRIVGEGRARNGQKVHRLVGVAERAFPRKSEGRGRPPALGEDTAAVLEQFGIVGSRAPRLVP